MRQIDNKSAVFQLMTWYWKGDKLLPEPVITNLSEAIWRL